MTVLLLAMKKRWYECFDWLIGLIKKLKYFALWQNVEKKIYFLWLKKHVYTPGLDIGNGDFATRKYSDCFCVYQVSDFANMGFFLKKVNHLV